MSLAAVLAPAAQAAPAAGGAQANLNVPLPASAKVLPNNVMQVCFDRPVSAVLAANSFEAFGFDSHRVTEGVSSTGVVSGSPDCVNVQFATGANAAPLSEFTRATVLDGAVKTSTGVQNVSGAVNLDGTTEAPRAGATAGPDLIGTPTVTTQSGKSVITYTFDQALDATPTQVPSGVFNSPTAIDNAFGYYAADGTKVSCGSLAAAGSNGVAINGNTVACTLPQSTTSANPPSRFYVLYKAVRDRPTSLSCCDVNPTGVAGGLTSRPTIAAATQSGPTQVTVTYSQPVTLRNVNQFELYTSDANAVVTPTSSSQPSPTQVVLNYPSTLANAAYKVVGIADPGLAGTNGGAVQSASSNAESATSYQAIRTAPIQAGRDDAPDLSSVSLNPSAHTAVFTFHGLVATESASLFHLLDAAGNATSGQSVVGVANGSPTGDDPTSLVTVRFPAAAVATARAGQVVGGAVTDFEGKQGLRNTVALSAPVGAATSGLALFGHTAFVSPTGEAGVFVGCFSGSTCHGTLRVSHSGVRVASRNGFTVASNNGGIVHLMLTPSGRSQLARLGHLGVTVTVSDASGTITHQVTLQRFFSAGPAVSPNRSGASLLTSFGHTAFVAPQGVVGVFVGCFTARTCGGSLTLRVNGARIGGRRFSVPAATGGIVHLRIGAKARATLRSQGHLTARLTVTGPNTATGPSGSQSSSLSMVRFG